MVPCNLKTSLFFALVLLLPVTCLASLQPRSAASPISVPNSQFWDGEDGKWSSFQVQIGTPPQQVRLFPSTAKYSIAPIIAGSCNARNFNGHQCEDARGFLFNPNSSLTWAQLGTFAYNNPLDRVAQLGEVTNASVGQDTVQLAWPGTAGPNLTSQPITMLSDPNDGIYLVGQLGLGPYSVNLTVINNPMTSPLSWLRFKDLIPSTSWGYAAGAYNQQPPAFGSLILGGYDTTLFRPNNLTFDMNADISNDLTVAIQRIRTDKNGDSLLPTPIFVPIDSEVPQIWLPLEACQAFERAFNLTFRETSGLGGGWYFLTADDHSRLQSLNPTVTFTLGSSLAGGQTIDIALPYSAFDLEMSAPNFPQGQKYFPLKRAANRTQYTLGRTFLQHAYLIADYDRKQFSLSQALFNQGKSPDIQTIYPPGQSPPGKTLSGGAIAGIVVGAVAGLGIVGVLVWFFIRRRRQQQRSRKQSEREASRHSSNEALGTNQWEKTELPADSSSRVEADGLALKEKRRPEIGGTELERRHEVGGAAHHGVELGTESEYAELDAPRREKKRWGPVFELA